MAIQKRTNSTGVSYVVSVRDGNGAWFERKSFKTKVAAVDYEADLIRQKSRGAKSVSIDLRQATYAEYWLKWSSECRGKSSDGWKMSQDQMNRDHIEPVIGTERFLGLGPSDIAKVLNKAAEKGLGPQMRLHLFNLIHSMFVDASEIYDITDANPCKGKLKPMVPKVKRNHYSPETAKQFLEHVRQDYTGPALWGMILMGLRIGEMQAVRWSDVDSDKRELSLSRQWNRKEKCFKNQKNGDIDFLPIPPMLYDYWVSIKPKDAKKSDLIMKPLKEGAPVTHYDTIYDAMLRLCSSFGEKRLTPHELRHTSTELWFEAGCSQEEVRRLLRHRHASSIKAYIHESPEVLKSKSGTVGHGAKLKLVRIK